jgi:hypothetical protein
MPRTLTLDPHHPDCRYPRGSYAGLDPERCCYCAALLRQGLSSSRGEDPLDYRYGGPGCACGPVREQEV